MARTCLLVALCACSNTEREAPEVAIDSTTPRAPSEAQRDSILSLFEHFVARHGFGREEIAASLGPPDAISVTAAEGPDGTQDTLVTLSFRGLVYIIRKWEDGRQTFSNILAIDSMVQLPAGIRVFKSSRSAIESLVGPSLEPQQFGDTLVLGYDLFDGPTLQFYICSSVLCRIRWVYELG